MLETDRPASVGRWLLLGVVAAGCGLALVRREHLWGPHLAFMAAALAAFVALLAAERRRPWLRPAMVWTVGGALLLGAVAAPPRESADVWSYVMYGRIVATGNNPYVTPPAAFPHDRWLNLVRPVWRDVPSLYGPLFDAVAGLDVRMANGSGTKARIGFELLAALAVLAAMALLWRRTRDPAAMALLGLNPIVVVGVVNGGHNDALVGLAVLGAVLLAEDRRAVGAGVAFGLALLVKPVAVLPLLALAVWLWRRRGLASAAVTVGVAGGVGLAGYQAGGGVDHALRAMASVSDLVTRFSVWRVTWMANPPALGEATEHTLHHAGGALPGWLPMAIVVGVALAAAWGWTRRANEGPVAAVGVAVVCYLLAGLYVLPWYVMWVLPVLALRWRWRVTWVGVLHASVLLAAYALALQKAFGPDATVARAVAFDVVAVGELAGLGFVLVWSFRRPPRLRAAPTNPTRTLRRSAQPVTGAG